MPRIYKPKPGAKTYKKHDLDIIKQALQDLNTSATSKLSIRAVAKKYDIPFSVLQRHNQKKMKPQGGQTALSPEVEERIVQNLNICADWGYPLEVIDLRYIIKMYLDSNNITNKRFNNNLPGPDFAESFLKRHSDKISKRISQNIKLSRAKVSSESIKKYFVELEKSLDGVPPSNIVNYDETNLSDDPGRQKVIVRRGCKYPERVRNHSKGCTSLMLAANAEGKLLPPYVVYKSTHLYDSWIQNGPAGTKYHRSSSGWFDGPIFVDWVKTMVIPYFEKIPGKKVLIGDNLSSHLSVEVITLCKEKNIHFVFLPPNSTHLTQPLDVAYFRPMKQAWRQILQKWKMNDGRCLSSIPKGCFPRLLKKMLDLLKPNTEKNIQSGFRKTGIFPLNVQEVISRLPNEMERVDESAAIDETFVKLLKEMRFGTMDITEPKKKRKLDVEAGRSVDPDEFFKTQKLSNSVSQIKSLKNKGKGKQSKPKHQPSPPILIQQEKPSPSDEILIPITQNTPISFDKHQLIPPPDIQPQAGTSKDSEIATSGNQEIQEVLSGNIESMPIIFEEDLIFSQEEEICEQITEPDIDEGNYNDNYETISDCTFLEEITPKQTNEIDEYVSSTNNPHKKTDKSKITVLSNELITYSYTNKRKSKYLEHNEYKKNKRISYGNQDLAQASTSTLVASTKPIRRSSVISKNYYNNADEILDILKE
ncbi:hypothetical protein ABMA28_015129 [Loxostege sticticalis]|uniref:DDE-1 domain-containing protein n=1 Tax=Loxostege sticticalis TaxID=481309 RepID=A0ABD0TEE9_LOXSC